MADVAERAGIVGHISPRNAHALADYIAKGSDPHTSQHVLGHDIATAQIYLAKPRRSSWRRQ